MRSIFHPPLTYRRSITPYTGVVFRGLFCARTPARLVPASKKRPFACLYETSAPAVTRPLERKGSIPSSPVRAQKGIYCPVDPAIRAEAFQSTCHPAATELVNDSAPAAANEMWARHAANMQNNLFILSANINIFSEFETFQQPLPVLFQRKEAVTPHQPMPEGFRARDRERQRL